ncbi:hypothetical protein PF004_g30773 [Phytophthora fragariae]|uniref:Uncharacterized protein n=1 Tax=Phytophthora fragariae TaxID=53985 RepID=A0A6G0MBP3_9STRA|nr:hypothetical protein PF004_g30773 [Phytophthora fragariae]
MSPKVLHRVESRRSSPKTASPVEIVVECWLKCRGERPDLMKIFIALDALRPVLNELYGTLYQASKVVDSANGQPAPGLDPELYFDPSVAFAPPANLPWVPASADWCAASSLIDWDEPWRAWWLRQPALHPYNECFLPLHPEFPVFSSADFDHAQVRSLVAEDVDPSAPAPPLCSVQAPTPANREELSISESILEASDDASA